MQQPDAKTEGRPAANLINPPAIHRGAELLAVVDPQRGVPPKISSGSPASRPPLTLDDPGFQPLLEATKTVKLVPSISEQNGKQVLTFERPVGSQRGFVPGAKLYIWLPPNSARDELGGFADKDVLSKYTAFLYCGVTVSVGPTGVRIVCPNRSEIVLKSPEPKPLSAYLKETAKHFIPVEVFGRVTVEDVAGLALLTPIKTDSLSGTNLRARLMEYTPPTDSDDGKALIFLTNNSQKPLANLSIDVPRGTDPDALKAVLSRRDNALLGKTHLVPDFPTAPHPERLTVETRIPPKAKLTPKEKKELEHSGATKVKLSREHRDLLAAKKVTMSADGTVFSGNYLVVSLHASDGVEYQVLLSSREPSKSVFLNEFIAKVIK